MDNDDYLNADFWVLVSSLTLNQKPTKCDLLSSCPPQVMTIKPPSMVKKKNTS